MLRSMKDMEHYTLGATDGIIGRVRDFYFDDESWVIRYLVVNAGAGQAQRTVLISPISRLAHETRASRSSVVAIMLSYKIERCDRPARR
jgi:hypothetical protein